MKLTLMLMSFLAIICMDEAFGGEPFVKNGQRAWFHDPGLPAGMFHTYDQFFVPGMAQSYKIHVFLPRDFERRSPEGGYPILLMQDGETAFFPSDLSGQSIEVPQAIQTMIEKSPNQAQPIVVGVVPNSRERDYTLDHVIGRECCGFDAYRNDIVKGLLPWLYNAYPVSPKRQDTGVSGSSHGGLAAFLLAVSHPDIFGYAIAQSPSFWVGLESRGDFVSPWSTSVAASKLDEGLNQATNQKPLMWIDWGEVHTGGFHNQFIERYAAKRSKEVCNLLVERFGYKQDRNLFCVADPLGEHQERFWAERFALALQAMLIGR